MGNKVELFEGELSWKNSMGNQFRMIWCGTKLEWFDGELSWTDSMGNREPMERESYL